MVPGFTLEQLAVAPLVEKIGSVFARVTADGLVRTKVEVTANRDKIASSLGISLNPDDALYGILEVKTKVTLRTSKMLERTLALNRKFTIVTTLEDLCQIEYIESDWRAQLLHQLFVYQNPNIPVVSILVIGNMKAIKAVVVFAPPPGLLETYGRVLEYFVDSSGLTEFLNPSNTLSPCDKVRKLFGPSSGSFGKSNDLHSFTENYLISKKLREIAVSEGPHPPCKSLLFRPFSKYNTFKSPIDDQSGLVNPVTPQFPSLRPDVTLICRTLVCSFLQAWRSYRLLLIGDQVGEFRSITEFRDKLNNLSPSFLRYLKSELRRLSTSQLCCQSPRLPLASTQHLSHYNSTTYAPTRLGKVHSYVTISQNRSVRLKCKLCPTRIRTKCLECDVPLCISLRQDVNPLTGIQREVSCHYIWHSVHQLLPRTLSLSSDASLPSSLASNASLVPVVVSSGSSLPSTVTPSSFESPSRVSTRSSSAVHSSAASSVSLPSKRSSRLSSRSSKRSSKRRR